MDNEVAQKLMGVLVENSTRVLLAGFGVNYAEQDFFAVVDLLKSDRALKQPFLDLVGETFHCPDAGRLDPGMVPRELVELVAHETRWEDFRLLAQERVDRFFHGDWKLAIGDVARGVIEAQVDNWPDREFYSRYKSP